MLILSKSVKDQLKNVQKQLNKEIHMKSAGRDAIHHLGFQAPNPMTMTSFERELKHKEEDEREVVRKKQVEGMQGYDGGRFDHQQW